MYQILLGFLVLPLNCQNSGSNTVGFSGLPVNGQNSASNTVGFSGLPVNGQNGASNTVGFSGLPVSGQNGASNTVGASGLPVSGQNGASDTIGFSCPSVNRENCVSNTVGFSGGPSNCLFGNNPQPNDTSNTITVFSRVRQSGNTVQDTIVSNSVPANIFGGRNVRESYVTIDKMVLNPDSFSNSCSFGLSVNTKLVLLNDRPIYGAKDKCERMNKQSIMRMQTRDMMDAEDACCICFDNDRSIVSLLPCAHTCLCMECLQRLITDDSSCPLCRSKIRGYLK